MSPRVAVLNTGSSTVKLALIEVNDSGVREKQRIIQRLDPAEDLVNTVRAALDQLESTPDAFGHRVVHGGARYIEPTALTDRVEAELEQLVPLAPLHIGPALLGIREAKKVYPKRPAVAVFDTAFHAHRPRASMRYALPHDIVDRFGLRRYGFHGIAHEALVAAVAETDAVQSTDVSGVTLQLGAGCSACAVRGGRSVETSMGFTPLEGLVMTTRSGNIDPAIVLQLIRAGYDAARIERDLTVRSGIYGVSGLNDMRSILAADKAGIPNAQLAIEIFCRSIVATVGAYFTLLGGAEALVFGGGIGANAPQIRSRIADGLKAWHVALDSVVNESNRHGRISVDGSPPVYALQTDEERLIARRVAGFLSGSAAQGG